MILNQHFSKEQITLSLIVVLYFVGLFIFPVFPFQRNSLFADSPTSYESYEVYFQGEPQDLQEYELANYYDGDPTFTAGRHFKSSYQWGQILSPPELEAHLQKVSTTNSALPSPVCIHKVLWGPLSDGQFGVQTENWFLWQGTLTTANVAGPKCN